MKEFSFTLLFVVTPILAVQLDSRSSRTKHIDLCKIRNLLSLPSAPQVTSIGSSASSTWDVEYQYTGSRSLSILL